jgi:ribosome-associated protein
LRKVRSPAFAEPDLQTKEPTLTSKPSVKLSSSANDLSPEPMLLARIQSSLDDDKAEDIVTIDLTGRSSLTDAIVVATGRSARHVTALAENLARRLKDWGYGAARMEGLSQGDWVLIDAGDVVAHIFRAEVRAYYDLEGMWSVDEVSHRRRSAEHVGSIA